MIEATLDTLLFWLVVLMRMTGMVFFNSILGRNNVPIILRIGLTVLLTFFTVNILGVSALTVNTWVGFGFILIKELVVGFFMGYLISAVLSIPMVAGEVLDMQLGISMSKIYDPQSNISMPITGSIFNAMFIVNFFMANGHLTLISLMVQSFQVVPPGAVVLHQEMIAYSVGFVATILFLALKLALPFIGIQMLTEIGVGILMKAIPQINVFVLNVQLKLLMGFFLIMVLMPEIAVFMDQLLAILLENLSRGVATFFA